MAREAGGRSRRVRRRAEGRGDPPSQRATGEGDALLWLRRHKGPDGAPLIGDGAFRAGERLAREALRAGLAPRVTMDWSRAAPPGGAVSGLHPTEAMLDARDRVRRALGAVGPEFAGVLLDLCVFGKGLERLERERGWPARSGKVVAALALAALARHYGYGERAIGPARSGVEVWTAAEPFVPGAVKPPGERPPRPAGCD